jgi:DNA-binding transcriptional LysR family regulator
LKLDQQRLAIFRAVVEAGSMSRAAVELRFSPAAVSQHVAALERQVGVPLLIRHARGVRTTAAGDVLARRAAELEQHLGRIERELEDLVRDGGDEIRLGIFTSATIGLLPRVLETFVATSRAQVAVHELDAHLSADGLRHGRLDVAVVFDDISEPELDVHDLKLTEIGADPFDVMLPADHRLAGQQLVALAELRTERWILPHGDVCARLVQRSCRSAGFEPLLGTSSDDFAAVRRLTASHLGVAAVPRLAGHHSDLDVVIVPLDPAPTRTLYLAVAGLRERPAAVGALRDAFLAHS